MYFNIDTMNVYTVTRRAGKPEVSKKDTCKAELETTS